MLIASNIINMPAMGNHVMDQTVAISQFDFIKTSYPLMHKVLLKAEAFFYSDPDHTLVETRKFVELLVNWLAELKKLDFSEKPTLEVCIKMVDDALKLDPNRVEQTVQSTQKRVNLLTQSILAKAFSGELTAEWREQHQDLITGVNSAEALLAKIQAEREASKPAKKTRKKKEV